MLLDCFTGHFGPQSGGTTTYCTVILYCTVLSFVTDAQPYVNHALCCNFVKNTLPVHGLKNLCNLFIFKIRLHLPGHFWNGVNSGLTFPKRTRIKDFFMWNFKNYPGLFPWPRTRGDIPPALISRIWGLRLRCNVPLNVFYTDRRHCEVCPIFFCVLT